MLDYPAITTEVESYNKESFSLWRNSLGRSYNATISGPLFRFHDPWQRDPDGCFTAIERWLKTPNDTMAGTCGVDIDGVQQ